MRIKSAIVDRHYPHSDDILIIEDEYGNDYRLSGDELQDILVEQNKMCGECFGSGETQDGEFDDIITKKCTCKGGDEEDNDDDDS